ncbi:uncharacterized protein A4U43_C04F28770, partial [Asparagus officinalis]
SLLKPSPAATRSIPPASDPARRAHAPDPAAVQPLITPLPQPASACSAPKPSDPPLNPPLLAAGFVPSAMPHQQAAGTVPPSVLAPSSSLHTPRPPPPQKQSYAQAAKGAQGNGFVSAHACEIDSFARLPPTGINIISGSRDDMPSFSFISSGLPKIENVYANALVMKFFGGRPSLEVSQS